MSWYLIIATLETKHHASGRRGISPGGREEADTGGTLLLSLLISKPSGTPSTSFPAKGSTASDLSAHKSHVSNCTRQEASRHPIFSPRPGPISGKVAARLISRYPRTNRTDRLPAHESHKMLRTQGAVARAFCGFTQYSSDAGDITLASASSNRCCVSTWFAP